MPADDLRCDLQERVNYDSLEMPFYIRSVTFSSYCPSLCHACHWHEDLEFLYTRKGHITYCVDKQVYPLEEGDGIFVNSNHLHYGYSSDGTDCTFSTILLPPILLCASPYIEQKLVLSLTRNASFPACLMKHGDPVWAPVLNLLHQAAGVYSRREDCYELELISLFFRIASHLIRNMPREEAKNSAALHDLVLMKKMIAYIEQNLNSRLTLRDIAASGHICESKCCRLFQKYVNRTPFGYVNEARLEKGCQLLKSTSASIGEIAVQTGFGGSSYFAERFRAAYGMTPTAYRKRSASASP